jgi:hypothetical protein
LLLSLIFKQLLLITGRTIHSRRDTMYVCAAEFASHEGWRAPRADE